MAKSDYTVGYGKPPRDSQFKPGQSGNPSGRPKGTKNLKTDLLEELAERVNITEGGRPRTISKQRAVIKSMTAKAISGDARATQQLIQLMAGLFGVEEETEADRLAADDAGILDLWAARKQTSEG